ncbi:MAG: hypothetical protein RL695_102 [Pseudomonadota bacterium]
MTPQRIPDAELAAWLRLTLISGIGGETQRSLLAAFGLPEAIFAAGMTALRNVVGPLQTERLLRASSEVDTAIATTLAWVNEPGNHILTLADADYPQALLRSADPPVLLYLKGRIELLNRPALAIVGSRNATPQGLANAEAFAQSFATAGLGVVSGMALGVDTAAHRGALAAGSAGGATIAVIGTGADRIYPARNRALAQQIALEGIIVSEFPLGTPALAGNFPRRNRIIAGLAQGCLVVEAAARSGSLITARLAAEAGREVFAIPGSIHSPLAKGCHQLIKQGAKLVESAQDVLEELTWSSHPQTLPPRPTAATPDLFSTDDPERASLLAALGHDPCTLDQLAERSGLTAERLLAMLLPLELEGRVACLPGGIYQRLRA